MKGNVRYIAILVAVLIVAVISLANMQEVTLNLLLVRFSLPLIILILICLLLGALLSILIGLPMRKKKVEKVVEDSEKSETVAEN